MSFEELQQEWKAVKIEPRSHDDLRRMMYSSRASYLGNVSWKEILRLFLYLSAVLVIGLLFSFFNDRLTTFFTVLTVVEIFDDFFGLRFLLWLPHKDTIQDTVKAQLAQVKTALALSRLVRVVIWLVLVWIVAAKTHMEFWDIVLMGLATLPLVLLMNWWGAKKWLRKIAALKAVLDDLTDDQEVATGT